MMELEEVKEALARHETSLKAQQHQIDELKTIQEEREKLKMDFLVSFE